MFEKGSPERKLASEHLDKKIQALESACKSFEQGTNVILFHSVPLLCLSFFILGYGFWFVGNKQVTLKDITIENAAFPGKNKEDLEEVVIDKGTEVEWSGKSENVSYESITIPFASYKSAAKKIVFLASPRLIGKDSGKQKAVFLAGAFFFLLGVLEVFSGRKKIKEAEQSMKYR